MKIKSLLFTFIIAILSFSVYSQDPLYSQFYFNSVFTNPSLIGSNHAGTKIVYNQRQQWQKIPGSLSTSTFSMDMNCPKNTNFGIMAFHDSEGEWAHHGPAEAMVVDAGASRLLKIIKKIPTQPCSL